MKKRVCEGVVRGIESVFFSERKVMNEGLTIPSEIPD